jgi:hypothetical protein
MCSAVVAGLVSILTDRTIQVLMVRTYLFVRFCSFRTIRFGSRSAQSSEKVPPIPQPVQAAMELFAI